MTHFFYKEIDKESVVNLILAIDADDAEDIDLYYSSNGGDMNMAEVLIDYLSNSVKEITLIGHWNILSAALEVFIRSVCKKRLLPDAYGMVHLADRDISVRDVAKHDPEADFLVHDTEEYNKNWVQEHQKFFTKKEMIRIKNGDDVYLDHDRLLKYVEAFGYVLVEEEKTEEDAKGV